MIGDKVTVVVHGAQGPTTIRAHITGPAAPAGAWYYGTDWGSRGVIAEADLGVKWLHGWPDGDEMKALVVAAALSEEEGAWSEDTIRFFGGFNAAAL